MQTNQTQSAPKKQNVAAKVAKREKSGLNAAEFKVRVISALVRMNNGYKANPGYTLMDEEALLEKVRRAPRSAKLFFSNGQVTDGKQQQLVVYLKTEDRDVFYGATYGDWRDQIHVTTGNDYELDRFFHTALETFYSGVMLVDKLDPKANAPVKTRLKPINAVKEELKAKATEAFGVPSTRDAVVARGNFKKELQRTIMQVSQTFAQAPYYLPVDEKELRANIKSIGNSGELYFHSKPSAELGVLLHNSPALTMRLVVVMDARSVRALVLDNRKRVRLDEKCEVKKLRLDLIPMLHNAFKALYTERALMEQQQPQTPQPGQDWLAARGTAMNIGSSTAVRPNAFQSTPPAAWSSYPTPMQQGFRATPPQGGLFGGTSLKPSGMPSQQWAPVALSVVAKEMEKAQEAVQRAQMEVARLSQLGSMVQHGHLNFQGQITAGEDHGQFSVALTVVLTNSEQDQQLRHVIGDTFSVTNTYSGAFPAPSQESNSQYNRGPGAAATHIRQRLTHLGFGNWAPETNSKLHRVVHFYLAAQGKTDPQLGAEIIRSFASMHPTQEQYEACMNVLDFYYQRGGQVG
jgi:hypothetical protein